ncbi:MAG: 30S ribosomal protein S2 [Candidatus Magasanikbacteria bacterium GW2011_GWA2_42_32]|uniref:Small ribosomal subunit protein uS2 n=1 Tax=Candidatus Magasanikbacteria bacterium GW2011_GWA2_42_32 TaxID=1619039 RepID=A0A0G0ZZ14_9BACT|nr:MAG: 30S ribosomal protein S2 [Candidatus Magasanikbacteria bacterium GW2011_GWA2_42_32]
MLKIPDVLDLLKAGAHFGHKISKWHPKMAPFIFTERNQVHIINLEETQKKLQEALNFLRQSAAQNKIILFVGTKDQAQEIITRHAKDAGVPFVTNRWLGGLLTNFQEIQYLSGIESLERRPDVIFIIDLKKEKTALNEALLCKTKIVALCDTNVNPDKIDYPIPSNDDAIKTIELITGLAAEAVKEGKNQAASVVAAPTVSVPV